MSAKEAPSSGESTDTAPDPRPATGRVDPEKSRPYWSPNEGDEPA
jgi:hypothetical protein